MLSPPLLRSGNSFKLAITKPVWLLQNLIWDPFVREPWDMSVSFSMTWFGNPRIESWGMSLPVSMNWFGNPKTDSLNRLLWTLAAMGQVSLSISKCDQTGVKAKNVVAQLLISALVCCYSYIYIGSHRQNILSPQWKAKQHEMNMWLCG